MWRFTFAFLFVAASVAASADAARAVTIETVPVGNAGNLGEQSRLSYGDTTYYGGVNYTYKIGKYEVTAGQYCAFLNAVAGVDTYGLFNAEMWSSVYGCKIERFVGSGTAGDPYRYRVADDWANRPVNYVSWGDAARFANWLHHGQPIGTQNLSTTEDGAYYLNGRTQNRDLLYIPREADWQWALPTEDEWYKAAYHKNDGATGNYFDYPTGSDTAPGRDVADPLPGNNADYYVAGDPAAKFTIGGPYYRTIVGEFENSASAYGTYDQGGNVDEWDESLVWEWDGTPYISARGIRGGSFGSGAYALRAEFHIHYGNFPPTERSDIGFRVVTVPEGATSVLGLGGVVCLLFSRRRLSR
jgi:formylglycine-generating enzyme